MVLVSINAVNAKTSLGVDLGINYDYGNSIRTTPASTNENISKNFSFHIRPEAGFRRGDIMEIAPSVIFGLSRYYSSSEFQSTKSSNERIQFNLGAGLGFYFYVIHGTIIELGLGPQIGYNYFFKPSETSNDTTKTKYQKYVQMSIPFAVPLKVDFHVSNNIIIRLSGDIIGLSFNYTKSQLEQSQTENTSKNFSFDLYSLLAPRLGIYVTF